MKNMISTLKTLTIAMLTIAIVLTSIVMPNENTMVSAASVLEVKDTKSFTMKPGATQKFIVTGKTPQNTDDFYWTSSDENVVRIEFDFVDQTKDYTTCILLKAVSSGTATITGIRSKGAGENNIREFYTIKIKVFLPKATAKQKKCKHKYKTTQKPTCERAGIKTCKKCKYQKELKKVNHKYEKQEVNATGYEGFWFVRECDCGFRITVKFVGEVVGDSVYTTYPTGEERDAHITSDSEYPTWEAAMDAYGHHDCKYLYFCNFVEYENEWGETHYTEIKDICKYCGQIKPLYPQ